MILRRCWLALPVLAALSWEGCGGGGPQPGLSLDQELSAPPLVRVAVRKNMDEVEVGAPGAYTVRDGGGVRYAGRGGEWLRATVDRGRVVLRDDHGAVVAEAGEVRLRPDSGLAYVALDRYPGELVLRPARNGKGVHVINVVDLETYLRGVVPSEIGHTDRYVHAAMAQAVAARTYAVRNLRQYDGDGYDLDSGTMDQVYSPVEKYHDDADRAVEATRGMILVQDDRPIRATYSSTCGGRTAEASESFSFQEPYLISQKDEVDGQVCCRTSKYYRWEVSWSGEELYRILSRNVPAITGKPWRGSRIQQVEGVDKGESGRVVTLRIETDATHYDVSRLAIRQVLERPEGGMLRSTDFELSADRKDGRVVKLTAKGRGWGHGVGMCQWGAMQLSTEGYDYRRILAHYYPGVELRRLY